MGAAASAISQQDLTNEEKTVITKVSIYGIKNIFGFMFFVSSLVQHIAYFSIWRNLQVLQEKYHAMREDEATKDAHEIEVFGTLST